MRRSLVVFWCVVMIAAWSAGSARAADPFDAETIAGEMVRASGWEFAANTGNVDRAGRPGAGALFQVERTEYPGGIAHYAYVLRTGPGEHDKIGLHRVVKERRPNRPIRTSKNLFFLHGTPGNFTNVFFFGAVSSAVPIEHSIAYYLASNDVDVWGIDQAWSLLPIETTDFSFMEDWGMQRNVDDLGLGLSIARLVRLITGCGLGKMNLLGYSTGLMTGFAYLNEESQRPVPLRNVGGFVPVDLAYVSDDASYREAYCAFIPYYEDLFAAGIYYEDFTIFGYLGGLATSDPDGDSPAFPGYTNYQAAILGGAAPYPPPDDFHFVTADWEGDVPTGLAYTDEQAWFDFMQHLTPYGSARHAFEFCATVCGETDLPYDDHLGDITVPIFYLGAAGGVNEYGFYVLSLLGSDDVTTHVVRLLPPGEELLDYGHIDLFTGEDAQALAWEPVLDWINGHDHLEAPPAGEESVLAMARPRTVDPALRVTPNPGRTSSYTFSFEMTTTGRATIEIYDVAGRMVAGPLEAAAPAGRAHVSWNAASPDGRRLGQGIYLARVATPEGVRTAKFVHLGP